MIFYSWIGSKFSQTIFLIERGNLIYMNLSDLKLKNLGTVPLGILTETTQKGEETWVLRVKPIS